MSTEFDFSKENKVSVWFSTLPYDQVDEAYFAANEEGVEQWMQNFLVTDIDVENIEMNGVEKGLADIRDVLAPCSYSSGYADLVEHKIKKMGEQKIAWIMLVFDYEYRPKKTKVYKDECLHFVGSYPFDMDDANLVELPED